MPAAIFENKFVAVRQPAWHRLGYVSPEPITVAEAVEKMGGLHIVEKRQLQWEDGTPSPWYGLARIAPDGRIDMPFAPVSEAYHLVTPQDFVYSWELGTENAKVETMGVLDNGKTMFITCPLPDTAVRGDEIKRFMVAANFMNGETANMMTVSHIRVVCQNTLNAALADTNATFKLNHDAGVIQASVEWLRDAYGAATARAEAVRQALELFAGTYLADTEARDVVMTTVPDPQRPRPSGSPRYDREREEAWQNVCVQRTAERNTILATFQGDGVGMDTPAARGTAFGMYNAIAETYEHILPSTNEAIGARSYLFGTRGVTVQRGFNALLNICRN